MNELGKRIAQEHRICTTEGGGMVCLCLTPEVDGPTTHATHITEVAMTATRVWVRELILREADKIMTEPSPAARVREVALLDAAHIAWKGTDA